MLARPQFKKYYAVHSEAERVILKSEAGSTLLEGRLFGLLAPLLDGRHTTDEIVERLTDQANVLDVQYGLSLLRNEGHIVEAHSGEASTLDGVRNLLKSSGSQSEKFLVADGGYRVVPPEVTYERYRHHIDLSGVVGSVEPAKGYEDDNVVHVYLAVHNFTVKSLSRVGRARRNASAGKGTTRQEARTGALCEALERYSGLFRGHEAALKASYRECAETAIHPALLMNFSDAQYSNRDRWNRSGFDYNWIPKRFRDDEPIEWSQCWSLTRDCIRYLPAAYCYYAYPHSPRHDFCRADSNGNASGNTIEEAVLQGFLELVERDAVALWWYNRARRPSVDLASFDDPYFSALSDRYRELGRELWALDITTDLNIPAFAAVSPATRSNKDDLMLGFGAHLDPRIALSRALTELNQFLPAVLAGTRIPRLTSEPVSDDFFCRPDPKSVPCCHENYLKQSCDNLRQILAFCIERVRRRNLEVLVLDQTRPDVGLPTVKVVVPGLRQFWARFGPGRLYDVPADLGWLSNPVIEGDLNPAHLLM